MAPFRVVLAALVLGLAPLVGTAAAQDGGQSVALVVGNGLYPDGDAPLATPVADARALGAELQRRGFAVEVAENLSSRGLREASDRLLAKVRPGSVVLVAFAGYGIQSARQNYLVPVDGEVWTEVDLQKNGLSVARLLTEIERRGAGATYLALDAAYRNPFERRFRTFSTGLAAISSPPANVSIIFSGTPGTVLKEGSGPRSTFSTELVKQVAAAGGFAPAVFDRTRVAVSDATGGAQVPWVLTTSRAPAASAGAAPAAVSSAVEAVTGAATSGDAFRAAQQAGTRDAYEAFLARTGTGPFADLARLELARLRTAPEPQRVAEAPRVVEPPRTEPPRAELPRVEPPRIEPPRAEPPRAELPRQEPPRVERPPPRIETSRVEPPRVEPPKVDPPRVEPPRAEPSKVEPPRNAEPGKQAALEPPSRPALPYSADDARLRDDLTATLARGPAEVGVLYTRGQLYAMHEEFRPALADFDAVLRAQPKDVEALNNRCWVRAIVNEVDGALADCNAALQLRPDFLDALDSRGFVNLKIGLPRRAVADYDAALKVDARHASALYGRGVARLRNGQAAEGRRDMASALAIDPDIAGEFVRYGVK